MTTEPGELVFMLDNTFSWLVAKRVQLDVHVTPGLLGVTSALDPPAAADMAPQPSLQSTIRMRHADDEKDAQQQLRKSTAQAAHTAVEIVDRVAARVPERQARLGLLTAASNPPDALSLRQCEQRDGHTELSGHQVTNVEQLKSEQARSARLAQLAGTPMRGWTQGRVVEWTGALELSPTDAAVVKAAMLEEEINGDDLADLKPKCARPLPAPHIS